MPLGRIIGAFLFCLLAAPAFAAQQGADTITVFAAASLTEALQNAAKAYETASGKKVVLSFAGSMALAKQIEASSGADMFISADTDSMDYVDMHGLIRKDTRKNLVSNALVLIAPAGSKATLAIAPGFKLGEALHGGRLAMANVDTVPAGKYGKAALTQLGVWDSVKDHLAQGEDVRATLAYVARGEAPYGIVYATDARVEPKVRVVGTFAESSHPPIVYPVALTKDARPGAAELLRYFDSPAAQAIFSRAGFMHPAAK